MCMSMCMYMLVCEVIVVGISRFYIQQAVVGYSYHAEFGDLFTLLASILGRACTIIHIAVTVQYANRIITTRGY